MIDLAHAIRRRRRLLGLTLQQLADAAGCSKAYLSEIENHRHPNPPSARLIAALEAALRFGAGELRRLADWQSTPPAVRADYQRIARRLMRATGRRADGAVNLDAFYRSGDLHRAAAQGGHPSTSITENPPPTVIPAQAGIENNLTAPETPGPAAAVPLINRVAAGYPSAFTDLDYPVRVADEYVACPGLADPSAFAARVVGDSMLPDYRAGDIVIFSPEADPADGADCFVRILPDHETTFKRIFFEPDRRLRLEPLNPAFAPRTLSLDDLSGLYPAVYRVQPIRRRC